MFAKLKQTGCLPQQAEMPSEMTEELLGAVHRYGALSSSRLYAVQLENLLGVTENLNVPGVAEGYPNWACRLPVALEDFPNHRLMATEADVIGIDEAQFFDEGLVEVCNTLANRGKRIIIAGLDMDFKGVPFGPMPALCAIAEDVTKVHAICVRCGNLAHVSHRIVAGDKQVMLGELQEYEPLCRHCYNKTQTS